MGLLLGLLTLPVSGPVRGTIWVADGGHSQFQLFAPDGTFLEAWGGEGQGTGDGQFDFVRPNSDDDAFGAVAFAPDGSFYVADMGNRRIQHFSADRAFLNAWGGFGAEDGQFISPIDIAVDSQGNVFVDDDKRQILEADILPANGMGGDHDPDTAIDEAGLYFAGLRGRVEARQHGDLDSVPGEALAEDIEMLSGQHRRRSNNDRLTT